MIRPTATRKVILLVFVFTGICNSVPSFAHEHDNHYPRSIYVNGTGRISVVPDKAELTLSVEVRAKNAEAARNQAATSMGAVIKALKAAGVADKDIQTQLVSLYPFYETNTRNKISGYQLTNQIAVVIRKIENVSKVVDSAVSAGGNSTRVQGLSFSVADPGPALKQAREKAFEDAHNKAVQYAQLAHAKLSSPLRISEGGGTPPGPIPYAEMSAVKMAGAAALPTPVQIGEQEVTVTVNTVFAIE